MIWHKKNRFWERFSYNLSYFTLFSQNRQFLRSFRQNDREYWVAFFFEIISFHFHAIFNEHRIMEHFEEGVDRTRNDWSETKDVTQLHLTKEETTHCHRKRLTKRILSYTFSNLSILYEYEVWYVCAFYFKRIIYNWIS